MKLRPGRRAIFVLAAVGVAGGMLDILVGQPASSSDSVDAINASSPSTPAKRPATLAPPAALSRAATLADAKPLTALAHRTTEAPDNGNLFAAHSWYIAPPPPPPRPTPAPVAPTAPPLPYTFIGKYGRGADGTVYFLTRGDRVYDVKQGDVLDGIYRLDAVSDGQLTFTYMPLDERQTLSIGGDS